MKINWEKVNALPMGYLVIAKIDAAKIKAVFIAQSINIDPPQRFLDEALRVKQFWINREILIPETGDGILPKETLELSEYIILKAA